MGITNSITIDDLSESEMEKIRAYLDKDHNYVHWEITAGGVKGLPFQHNYVYRNVTFTDRGKFTDPQRKEAVAGLLNLIGKLMAGN